jgi:hypothetical protein
LRPLIQEGLIKHKKPNGLIDVINNAMTREGIMKHHKLQKILGATLILLGALTAAPAVLAEQAPWDKNNNAVCDLEQEDFNQDGVCDGYDVTGGVCWDKNSSGTCDVESEDTDRNGVCDRFDCAN